MGVNEICKGHFIKWPPQEKEAEVAKLVTKLRTGGPAMEGYLQKKVMLEAFRGAHERELKAMLEGEKSKLKKRRRASGQQPETVIKMQEEEPEDWEDFAEDSS